MKQYRTQTNGNGGTAGIFAFTLYKERDYFIENVSMMIAAGMPILQAIDSIRGESRSRRMRKILSYVHREVDAGTPIWQALQKTNIFSEHEISLLFLGEKSGRLIENLAVIASEQEKNRLFRSKIRSALMYPSLVLMLTVVIGVGITWFILPKLATVFTQLHVALPLITQIVIGIGTFLGAYGQYVIPGGIIIGGTIFYFIFSFSKTKSIGQYILFSLPAMRQLIKEIELARFGYLLGTLLDAGLPITQALGALANTTGIIPYQKLYAHLHDSIEEGDSFQKSFDAFRHSVRLIPKSVQQLIVSGEQSGTLSATLLKIGQTYETKSDTTTKNLSVIVEPILLVIVWLGVVAVALAVILPIYSLIGGFNAITSPVVSPPSLEEQIRSQPQPEIIAPAEEEKPVETKKSEEKLSPTVLRVLSTRVGYLNVRTTPATTGSILMRVKPGETFTFIEKKGDWFKIILSDNSSGWVFGTYVEVVEPAIN